MSIQTEVKKALKPPITVEQWGEMEGPPHYDLVAGQLKERPDVAFWHEILFIRFVMHLENYAKENKLGMFVGSHAKLKISAIHGREPDLFFIPKALYRLIGKNLFKGVPPLVIEILSPTNEKEDRVAKSGEYAELGVEQYWIVDFPKRRLEVYRLRSLPDGGRDYELNETLAEDAIFRPALFPGLEIPLAEIWPAEFENRTDDEA